MRVRCRLRETFIAVARVRAFWVAIGNPPIVARHSGIRASNGKRTKEPKVLTIAEFQQVVRELNDPYRTMVILDLATGLRCSELFALKWCDVIWDDLTL